MFELLLVVVDDVGVCPPIYDYPKVGVPQADSHLFYWPKAAPAGEEGRAAIAGEGPGKGRMEERTQEERTSRKRAAARMKIGELPDLRIVAIESLRLHEAPDERRLGAIEERLLAERVLKHPPVVADPGDGEDLIVLDGANRVSALRSLGILHLPVQVISLEDPSLEIRSWHHAVERLDRDFFLRALGVDGDVVVFEPERPRDGAREAPGSTEDASLFNGHSCTLTFAVGGRVALGNGTGVLGRLASLERVTSLYRNMPLFDRVSYTNLDDLRTHYPAFSTLVSFQPFDRDEIVEMVRAGRRLPAGITRIILPKRALGINMRLEFLELPIAVEHKHRCLQDVIHRKVAERSIRFYEEPTFRFDE